ncbi:ribonuclease H-like domain-containing protein, partial [Tanacetum coccineum]
MDLETAQNNAVAKLPLLKQENGNSFNPIARTTANADGTSTSTIPGPVTTEEKAQKKNDVKARSMLLMALPNEHLFNIHQLAILGENISKKDLNLKFLSSLPSEWNTHVVVWRNKPDLDTMSFNDLYNNFKIVKQEVKRTVTTSSSSRSQNMAFVSSPSSTNEVDTANIQISTVNTPVSTASTNDNTANLSDATVYVFLANHPNGSQLVHEDLEQIHEDDLEEIDLKWQLALLSMRARRYYQRTGKKITINGSDTASYDKSKSYMGEDEVPTNMDLMAFSDLEPEFEGYGPKSVCEDTSNEVKKTSDTPLVEELVSKKEKQTVFPKQQDKTARKPVKPKAVNTTRPNSAVVNTVRANQANGIPPTDDQGYVDNGCSRHMTSNISYLLDFQEFDGGYVTFGGGVRGGKITSKGTLKMGKLPDESKISLKIPRKNNMYSVDMKNIIPKESLTCLVTKTTLNESMLWHRRLGYINFKTINKLVKDNLVR